MTETRQSISAADIESNLGQPVVAEIAFDRQAVLEAINRGVPVVDTRRTRPFTRSMLNLVAKVRELVVEARDQQAEGVAG